MPTKHRRLGTIHGNPNLEDERRLATFPHRQFLDKTLEPELMVHMINGLDPYLMRKMVKETRPQTLDEAIK